MSEYARFIMFLIDQVSPWGGSPPSIVHSVTPSPWDSLS